MSEQPKPPGQQSSAFPKSSTEIQQERPVAPPSAPYTAAPQSASSVPATQKAPPATSMEKSRPAEVGVQLVEDVINAVNEFEKLGQLNLPQGYSSNNALRAAALMLPNITNKSGASALIACTQSSIKNALLKMVVLGLNPLKQQGAFIVYGTELTFQPEYSGNIAMAKRDGGLKDIVANVIYESDVFEYEINATNGRKRLIKHDQPWQNIDINKWIGAYAITETVDGVFDMEIMNKLQITTSWNQGTLSDTHKKFPDQMAKKTVINRALKPFIRATDDDAMMGIPTPTEPERKPTNAQLSNGKQEEVTVDGHSEEVREEEPKTTRNF